MTRIVAIICVISIFLTATDAVFAGLGKPLADQAREDAVESLKSSDSYRQALKALKEKGISEDQACAALEKMPCSQLELLGTDANAIRAGGLIDFLIFVLIVALLVYLIIVLIDAAEHPGYYRY